MFLTLEKTILGKKKVGNKAANLQYIMNKGLNVPNCLLIPVGSTSNTQFDKVVEKLSHELNLRLPSSNGWAIRSSAVDEDAPNKSLAGKYKTLIISTSSELLDAVKEVQCSGEENKMGVIIQTFIEPDFSGVVFSKDPVTMADEIVIEIAPGRGQNIVEGLVTPWTFRNNVSEYKEFPPELSRKLIEEITATTEKLKEELQYDIDMEFCIKNNIVYWLQLRPITSTQISFVNEQSKNILAGEWHLLDQCTEPVDPLSENLDPSGLFHSEHWDTTFVNRYPYIKVKPFINKNVEYNKDILQEWLSIKEKYDPLFDTYLNEGIHQHTYPLSFLWTKLHKRIYDYRSYCKEYMKRDWLISRIKTSRVLSQLIKTALGNDVNVDLELSRLLLGIDTLTAKKHRKLKELISEAKNHSDIFEISKDINGNRNHSWIKKFQNFVHEFGFESPHATICSLPTLAEQQDELINLIMDRLINENHEMNNHSVNEEAWKTHAIAIASKLNETQKNEFWINLKVIRNSTIRTEDDDYLLQKGVATIRMILIEIGRQLTNKKLIEHSNHIFFMLPDELETCIKTYTNPFSDRITKRLNEHKLAKKFHPPMVIKDGNILNNDGESQLLSGKIASPGIVRGTVYVMKNPLDRTAYTKVPSNSVIVAPVLTPSLVYNLTSIAALIIETGGFLSHGAIFAREKGIPALIAVQSATNILKTGEFVEVDAKNGIVKLIN